MRGVKAYERFPTWIVVLSNLLSLSIYLIGLYILLNFGLIFGIFYLLYIIWTELSLFRGSCVDCYYYGKICGFGKGKFCSFLFKKGDSRRFSKREITFKDLLPDSLIFLLPTIAGAVILVIDFSWTILILISLLFVLSFVGNAVIRGSFACKYCKQREIGCPAQKLFNKKK